MALEGIFCLGLKKAITSLDKKNPNLAFLLCKTVHTRHPVFIHVSVLSLFRYIEMTLYEHIGVSRQLTARRSFIIYLQRQLCKIALSKVQSANQG